MLSPLIKRATGIIAVVMTEHGGKENWREGLPVGVVDHHPIVIGLPRKGDPVFRRGQLLAQLHHVLIRFEVRVGLGQREQPTQRTDQHILGTHQSLDRIGIARIGGGLLQTAGGLIPGLDDDFKCFPLVLQVTLGGFHQVRSQIIAPLELDFDLCESILVAVLS